MVLDGPIDGPAFLAYVEQILVSSLAAGDIVVMTICQLTSPPACAPQSR